MPPKKKKQVTIDNNLPSKKNKQSDIIMSGVDSDAAAEGPLPNAKYSKNTKKAPLPESKSRVSSATNGRKLKGKDSRSNGESRRESLAGMFNHPSNALPKSAEGAVLWHNDVPPELLLQLQTTIVSDSFQDKFERHSDPVGPPDLRNYLNPEETRFLSREELLQKELEPAQAITRNQQPTNQHDPEFDILVTTLQNDPTTIEDPEVRAAIT